MVVKNELWEMGNALPNLQRLCFGEQRLDIDYRIILDWGVHNERLLHCCSNEEQNHKLYVDQGDDDCPKCHICVE